MIAFIYSSRILFLVLLPLPSTTFVTLNVTHLAGGSSFSSFVHMLRVQRDTNNNNNKRIYSDTCMVYPSLPKTLIEIKKFSRGVRYTSTTVANPFGSLFGPAAAARSNV